MPLRQFYRSTFPFQDPHAEKEPRDTCVDLGAEQKALLRILPHDMDRYRYSVLPVLYTEIRIGELCAPQWKDICLDDSTFLSKKNNTTHSKYGYKRIEKKNPCHIGKKSEFYARNSPAEIHLKHG